jgi:purine-nucleoside/S-methyl-5'-thioadenosine phosphorylase / adenosine deaminase
MIAIERHGLRLFEFETLAGRPGLTHAVFARQGGVSPRPWESLNVGGGVGDQAERVIENRRRAFRAAGRPVDSITDVWQVHSAEVLVMRAPRAEGERPPHADGMVTDNPDLTLFMRFADCVPVLLYDPRRRAVGIVHAGWKGTLARIAAAAVTRMQEAFGTRAEDLLAAIGPSIGPDHYPVGPEVVDQTRVAFVRDEAQLLTERKGEMCLDLWRANVLALEEAGVHSIEVAGLCTACHTGNWFSHRGEHGRTGRFGALIALREA